MFYLAAQQFHDTANTLHEFFQDLALNDLLDLHQIVKDWDGSPHTTEGDDINSILSSCLGIGASVAGAIPGGEIASAALGTISGIFSLAESASGGGGGGGGTPTTHMEEMIQTLFGHNQHLINKMLKDVFGEGDPTEIPPKGPFTLQGAEEEEVKPELDAVTLAKHTARISKVFENGKWLFDSISKHVGHFKKETKRRLVSLTTLTYIFHRRPRGIQKCPNKMTLLFPDPISRHLRHELPHPRQRRLRLRRSHRYQARQPREMCKERSPGTLDPRPLLQPLLVPRV